MLDTAALTGESVPRASARGKRSSAAASTRADFWRSRSKGIRRIYRQQILELVENATSQKAKMENFITRFAAYYTPS